MLAFTLSSAWGSCGSGQNVDLRQIHKDVFGRLEVQDQGQYGLCYAYAGSTLVDFVRLKAGLNIGSRTSPLEAGLQAAIVNENESEEGGEICDVVNALAQRGNSCPDWVPANEHAYQDLGLLFHTQVVQQVLMPFITKTEIFSAVSAKSFKSRQGLSEGQQRYLARFDKFYAALRREVLGRKFLIQDVPSAAVTFKLAQKTHVENTYNKLSMLFIQSMMSEKCQKNALPIPKMSCKKIMGARGNIFSEIDHQLQNLDTPVGISYCSVVLTSKTTGGLDGGNNIKSNCRPHASVIIGRRISSAGKCQYLVRNSWGKGYVYPWESSRGDVWINDDAIMKNVFSIHTIH